MVADQDDSDVAGGPVFESGVDMPSTQFFEHLGLLVRPDLFDRASGARLRDAGDPAARRKGPVARDDRETADGDTGGERIVGWFTS
jgi:hypothetical protein